MADLFNRLMDIDWQTWRGPALSALRIVGILVTGWVSITVLQRTVRGVRVRIANRMGGVDTARRAETLGPSGWPTAKTSTMLWMS